MKFAVGDIIYDTIYKQRYSVCGVEHAFDELFYRLREVKSSKSKPFKLDTYMPVDDAHMFCEIDEKFHKHNHPLTKIFL